MSLSKLRAGSGGFIERSLNTEMTRLQFLQMGGALVLTLFGVQNLINVFARHIGTPSSPTRLMATDPNGFGSRKFGQ